MLSGNASIVSSNARLGIDGFSLARKDSGIEVYTRELIQGMAKHRQVEVYTYTNIHLSDPDIILRNSNLKSPVSTWQKLKWELSGINALISPDTEVFHSPHFILPYLKRAIRKVVTIHDLAFLRYPHYFDWKTKLYYRLLLESSLKKADAIICISESCRQDVAHFFPFTRERLSMVHHGFRNYDNVPQDATILSAMKVQSPFAVMIGTLNPRKNLKNGIRAFEKISKKYDLDLLIVGSLTKNYPPSVAGNPRVKFTGFISDQQLSALYHTAQFLLYPSYYEGFGFPLLEAMSAGIPVVTANNSSLPEISGYPSDLLADAGSPDSIAAVIESVIETSRRQALILQGYNNLRRFSWESMIHNTLKVYDKA